MFIKIFCISFCLGLKVWAQAEVPLVQDVAKELESATDVFKEDSTYKKNSTTNSGLLRGNSYHQATFGNPAASNSMQEHLLRPSVMGGKRLLYLEPVVYADVNGVLGMLSVDFGENTVYGALEAYSEPVSVEVPDVSKSVFTLGYVDDRGKWGVGVRFGMRRSRVLGESQESSTLREISASQVGDLFGFMGDLRWGDLKLFGVFSHYRRGLNAVFKDTIPMGYDTVKVEHAEIRYRSTLYAAGFKKNAKESSPNALEFMLLMRSDDHEYSSVVAGISKDTLLPLSRNEYLAVLNFGQANQLDQDFRFHWGAKLKLRARSYSAIPFFRKDSSEYSLSIAPNMSADYRMFSFLTIMAGAGHELLYSSGDQTSAGRDEDGEEVIMDKSTFRSLVTGGGKVVAGITLHYKRFCWESLLANEFFLNGPAQLFEKGHLFTRTSIRFEF